MPSLTLGGEVEDTIAFRENINDNKLILYFGANGHGQGIVVEEDLAKIKLN